MDIALGDLIEAKKKDAAAAKAMATMLPLMTTPRVRTAINSIEKPSWWRTKECYHHHRPNGCRNGDNCSYKHSIQAPSPRKTPRRRRAVTGRKRAPKKKVVHKKNEALIAAALLVIGKATTQ